MKTAPRFRNLVLVLLAGFLLWGAAAGCAKKQVAETTFLDWTRAATAACVVDGQRVFYAVGKASGIRSATLLRVTADNNAQAEMARLIKQYTRRLATTAGLTATADEDLLALHQLSQAVVGHARIVEHRYDAQSKTLFALCRIDLKRFEQVLAADSHLARRMKAEMLSRARSVHGQMVAGKPRP